VERLISQIYVNIFGPTFFTLISSTNISKTLSFTCIL